LPSDSLLERGRVSRPPLRVWVANLLDNLAEAERKSTAWPSVDGCMNNAALIAVYRGDLRGAEELCQIQLRWVANLMREHGPIAVGELVIQPWINIGRLRRIQRDYQAALRHFTLLVDTMVGESLRAGPITLDAA